MAAVWAAGPEPTITTLECMLRAVPGVVVLVRREEVERGVVGGVEGRKVVAAARARPQFERRGEEAKRRKVEENRMVVGREGEFLRMWKLLLGEGGVELVNLGLQISLTARMAIIVKMSLIMGLVGYCCVDLYSCRLGFNVSFVYLSNRWSPIVKV